MKKNIEWLKDRLESLREIDMRMRKLYEPNSVEHRHFNGRLAVIDEVLDFIDELDEPEVLSEEWIHEHSLGSSRSEYVWVDDLENLLVPNQELPVIPKYVAKHLELVKNSKTLMSLLAIAERRSELPEWEKEYDWISANDETFARAWLDGFTVEEEKYNVKFKVKSSFGTVGIFLYKQGDEVLAGDNFRAYHPEEDKYRLTEQEIKDYDERFWPFAEPVE